MSHPRISKLLAQQSTIIIDMRSPVDFRDGCIPRAVNKNLRQLTEIFKLTDKSTPLIIYGDSDTTASAVRYLTAYGFCNVTVLPNYTQWFPPVSKS